MRVDRSCALSPALKFRTREQQRDALLRARGARNRDARALVERSAERSLAEIQRLLAARDARRDSAGPLDALQQRVRPVPVRRACPASLRASPACTVAVPAARTARAIWRGSVGTKSSIRRLETTSSCGVLNFTAVLAHAAGMSSTARWTVGRSPSLSRNAFAMRSTAVGRRLVGDEVSRELGRKVPRCRRMPSEIAQHGARLRDARLDRSACRGWSLRPARARRRETRTCRARRRRRNRSVPIDHPVSARANVVTSCCV